MARPVKFRHDDERRRYMEREGFVVCWVQFSHVTDECTTVAYRYDPAAAEERRAYIEQYERERGPAG
jgi:uncharacterized protein YkuJ